MTSIFSSKSTITDGTKPFTLKFKSMLRQQKGFYICLIAKKARNREARSVCFHRRFTWNRESNTCLQLLTPINRTVLQLLNPGHPTLVFSHPSKEMATAIYSTFSLGCSMTASCFLKPETSLPAFPTRPILHAAHFVSVAFDLSSVALFPLHIVFAFLRV